MRQAILFLTDKSNEWTLQAFHALEKSMKGDADIYMVYHRQGEVLPHSLNGINVFPFSSSILHDMGYQPIAETLLPGSNHFPLLKFFRENAGYDYYWLVEDDVRYGGDWKAFFDEFSENCSDFLSAYVERYEENPQWFWWRTLSTDQENETEKAKLLKSFNPIYRLSRQALRCIDEHLKKGWRGHHEVLIPTLLYNRGFSIEDFGGKGTFVMPGNERRNYTGDTFGFSPRLFNNGKRYLFHAIKEEKAKSPCKKNCVIVAAGCDSRHRQLLLGDADFDLHLLVYDKSYNKWYDDADFMACQSGYKMDMTYNYLRLHPEYLDYYEYFFLMDDDVEMSTEEVNKLFRYMRKYQLRIAQPSLVMSYYTYEHTLHNPICKLRYTNFVEMMIPCFSQEALKLVLPTFKEKARWRGIEWHWPVLIGTNKRDMAIIDDVKAIHGRRLQSWNKDCQLEEKKYIEMNQLSKDILEFDSIRAKSQDLIRKGYANMNTYTYEKKVKELEDMCKTISMALGNAIKWHDIHLLIAFYYMLYCVTSKQKYCNTVCQLLMLLKTRMQKRSQYAIRICTTLYKIVEYNKYENFPLRLENSLKATRARYKEKYIFNRLAIPQKKQLFDAVCNGLNFATSINGNYRILKEMLYISYDNSI